MKGLDKPICETKGCRKRVRDTYPLPHEIIGKHIKIFGWIVIAYKDKPIYLEYCSDCLVDREQDKYNNGGLW